MRLYIYSTIVLISLIFAGNKSEFPFISLNTTGADNFVKKHPKYNGDGVVIFILDSGVDMGVLGIDKLPDGSAKVIDVQDFSGQGDVFYQPAERETDEEGEYLTDGVYKLYGAAKLPLYPIDSVYYLGAFNESQMRNSGVEDPNNNGDKDDTYGILVFRTIVDSTEQWVAFVDSDGDTNVDDEKMVMNYAKRLDVIHLRGRDKAYAQDLLSIGLNIFPEQSRVSLHFGDNSHGSHCAGIAAGYRINGQKGFNGVAPGARIISLKIGNNTLSGGATVTASMKKAFEYAANYAAAHPQYYYALNMSYGIGSEIEGQSDIDVYLDDFFRQHDNLTLCTSNGNEGPGISSTGTPAASHRIISTGALLPQESARNTYGFFTRDHEIFYFSSRGGDSEKPDVVAPGAASSTVPYYAQRENMWGTSMASPNAAGSVALLLSGLKKEFPKVKPNNLLIKRALKNSAKPLEGYTWLDYGAGLIDIPTAWNNLSDLYRDYKGETVIDFRVSAPSTEFDSENGYTVFFNRGGYIPASRQVITIAPRLPKEWDADKKVRYFQDFRILTSGDFFSVRQQEKYFKGKNNASLHLYFDKDKMSKPGLYAGMIYGIPKEKSEKVANAIFRIPVATVHPYFFTPENGQKLSFKTTKLYAGKIQRYFVQVGDQVSALNISVSNDQAPDDRYRLYIFDQEGRNIHTIYSNKKRDKIVLQPQDHERGTWEFVFYSEYANRGSIAPKLNIDAYSIDITNIENAEMKWEAGSNPKGKATFLNTGSIAIKASLSGDITGYSRVSTYNVRGEEYRFPVKGERFINKIQYDIELINDDFEKMTDFAVNILDYDGNSVVKEGLTYKRLIVSFYPADGEEYQMEFIAGFTHAYEDGWAMRIKEMRFYTYPYKLITFPDTRSNLLLYPQRPLEATFEAEEPLQSLPADFYYNYLFHFYDDKKDVKIPVAY